MVKTKKKITSKRVKANRSTPPAVASLILDSAGNRNDINPRSLENLSNASRNEVAFDSKSEPQLETTMQKATENADLVGATWQRRIKKEGTPYWECPMCTGAKVHYPNPKKCQEHINKDHKMRVKELKIVKAPKAHYTPQPKIESPKRTLADAVHPKFRGMVEAQIQQQKLLAPLREQANRTSLQGNHLMKLVTMTESQAIMQLGKLSNKDLPEVARLAQNRGKRLLGRAARALCKQRGINPDVTTTEPSAKMMMIQDALRNASSRGQLIVQPGRR